MQTFVAIRSRRSLLHVSAMMQPNRIWSENLDDLAPLKGYESRRAMIRKTRANSAQIRIIKDTHTHLKPNRKKKPHRGYAFVVFEREKDMKGRTLSPSSFLFVLLYWCSGRGVTAMSTFISFSLSFTKVKNGLTCALCALMDSGC